MASTARSSFFDANATAVDSPDPSVETKEVVVGDGSCPVLPDDTETEAVRGSLRTLEQN